MSSCSTGDYLSDVCAVIVKQGVGKARADILTRQLVANGGKTNDTLDSTVTHVLVGNNVRLSRVPHLMKIKQVPDNALVLRADWLSACLVEGRNIGHAQYIVLPESPVKTSHAPSPVKPSPSAIVTKEKEKIPTPSKSQPEIVETDSVKFDSTSTPLDVPPSTPPETSHDPAETSHDPAETSHDPPSTSSMTSPKVSGSLLSLMSITPSPLRLGCSE